MLSGNAKALSAIERGAHLAKYIVISVAGEEHATLFPASLQHSKMLPAMPGAKPVSAGFFMLFSDGRIVTGGESTSLDLQSRPQDADVIRNLLTTKA